MQEDFYCTIAAQYTEQDNSIYQSRALIHPPEPNVKMRHFEMTLSTIDDIEEISQKEALYSINAWLDPSGIIHPCRWHHHTRLITTLGFNSEHEAEDAGWIKLSQMKWLIQGRFSKLVLTNEQKCTIDLWHSKNGVCRKYFESNDTRL